MHYKSDSLDSIAINGNGISEKLNCLNMNFEELFLLERDNILTES